MAIEALLRKAKASDGSFAASHRRCVRSDPVKSVPGRLPPELIQKIVRARFGEYRQCYEDGLRREPKLEGRVSVHFVINLDGHVSAVMNADDAPPDAFGRSNPQVAANSPPPLPSMPDLQVVACVVAAFRNLAFPAPEGGIVTVTYPIMFALKE